MGEDTKYCGNCQREVSASNFTVHNVHCQRNIRVCSLCGETVPRSRYQTHLTTTHTPAPCEKCGEEVNPLDVFSHEKESCPRRLVACQHCELEVPAAELQRHLEYCEARTERCKGCTKYVQVKYLQFHYEHDHKYLRPEDKPERGGSDDEGSEECPICLGPVTLPLCLECGHTFCMVCVKGIANTTKNCAICRRDISRDMLMDIRFCREEDIIKNYVNKPRHKKNTRSHSVPSRTTFSYTSPSPAPRRLVHHTTQDYDDMVNALLSSRISSTSYRYQRPSNTHTPPSYTPYSSSSSTSTSNTCSTSTSCQDSCKDSDKEDDDCCCSSSMTPSSSSSSSSSSSTTPSSSSSSSSLSSTSTTTTASTRGCLSSTSQPSTTTTSSSSYNRSSSISSSTNPSSSTISSSTPKESTNRTSTTNHRSTSSSTPSSNTTSTNTSSYISPKSSSSSSIPTPSNTTSSSSNAPSSTSSSSTTTTTPSSSSTTTTTPSSTSYSNGARPRRPTSLALGTSQALTTSLSNPTSPSSTATSPSTRVDVIKSGRPPRNATQEQYDRWLAFQLAKAEDDLPPSEFNRKHVKPSFRRSASMPERAESSSDSSSSSDTDDSPSSRRSSRRPPASPRTPQASSSTSSASSSTRSTPISKSSSDSTAVTSSNGSSSSSSSSSVLNTGARPKYSGLKKRVSFKEDTPPLRREAPVMLPCEFCDEVYPERDLMRHQTSCEHNETQLPRTSRLANRAASTTPTSPSPTLASPSRTSPASSRVSSVSPSTSSSGSASPASRRPAARIPTPVCTPPKKASAPSPALAAMPPRNPESGSRSPAPVLSRRSPTLSPPPGPPTTTITIVDQPAPAVVSPSQSAAASRPFSVSPAPSSSASSGSVSSSSSASPVPTHHTHTRDAVLPDTPTTDLELDMEDEDAPYMRPRRGRLLSSAIFSWRSISATGVPRRGYVRSNTAPLEDTGVDEDSPTQPVTTSLSATMLPASPAPESPLPAPNPTSPTPTRHITAATYPQSQPQTQPQTQPQPPPATAQDRAEPVFIKNPNKYRAPPPPHSPPSISPTAPTLHPATTTASTLHPATTTAPTVHPATTTAPTVHPATTTAPTVHPATITHQRPATIPYTHMNGHEPAPVPSKQTPSNPSKTSHVNGYLKFDSKPMMMNGYTQKELEELIPCEFCKKVFSVEKFQSHQTMCEATYWPPALRPASSPPAPTARPTSPPAPTARPTSPPAPTAHPTFQPPTTARSSGLTDQPTQQKSKSPHPESNSLQSETKSHRPEIKSSRSETRSPRPETRSPVPETKSPRPNTKSYRPDIRSPRPETKSPQPETQNYRSETKTSRPETKGSDSESTSSRSECKSPGPKSKSPIPARHNKGPAPPPPPTEESPKDAPNQVRDSRKTRISPVRSRMERSHSVMDDRIYYSSDKMRVNRSHLERTSSIKETSRSSRSSYYSPSAIARRWSSRDFLHGNSLESSKAYSTSGWSGSSSNLGGWSGSKSNLLSSTGFTSGHGWTSHVSMVRDDVRARGTTPTVSAHVSSLSTSSYYGPDGGETDSGGVVKEASDLDTDRAMSSDDGPAGGSEAGQTSLTAQTSLTTQTSLTQSSLTTQTSLTQSSLSQNNLTQANNHTPLAVVLEGGSRYRERSTSRPRPVTMYSASDVWGSLYDLHSPTRQFNIADAFSSASLAYKKRYIR